MPGSSDVVLGGVIAYANAIKQALLGVPAALLEQHGAVSDPVAEAMAEGVRRCTGLTGAWRLHCWPWRRLGEKPVG